MNVFHLLNHHCGVFSKDLKTRFGNKQIKLNGESIDRNHEIEVALDDAGNVIKEDVGDFIFHNIIPNDIWTKRVEVFGLTELFNSNIDNDLTRFLNNFAIVKIARNKEFIIKHNEKLSNDTPLA